MKKFLVSLALIILTALAAFMISQYLVTEETPNNYGHRDVEGQLYAPFGSFRLDLDTVIDLPGLGLEAYQVQHSMIVPVRATCVGPKVNKKDLKSKQFEAIISNDCTMITTGNKSGCVTFTAEYEGHKADFHVRVTDGIGGSPKTCTF